jgi:hypothetical protein
VVLNADGSALFVGDHESPEVVREAPFEFSWSSGDGGELFSAMS